MSNLTWHIITGEYPPRLGGVSHYTFGVAKGLAVAGDEVHVWCPAEKEPPTEAPDVKVHPELGGMSPFNLWRAGKLLNQYPGPRRLLVQWVPQGYGYKSMNLGFCIWLWWRAIRHQDQIELMAHEAFLPFTGSWKLYIAATIHRLMTAILLRAPKRVWMSIPTWEKHLRPYTFGRKIPFLWLPVGSNVQDDYDLELVNSLKNHYAPDGQFILGHFGTFGWPITKMLKPVLTNLLLKRSDIIVLLMGPGSEALCDELVSAYASLSGRILATGALTPEESPNYLKACDILFQPYPDGVSSRRTTLMAGLALEIPLVTTIGELSEPLWSQSGAVLLSSVNDVNGALKAIENLVDDRSERRRLTQAGKALYDQQFNLSNTVACLRSVIS